LIKPTEVPVSLQIATNGIQTAHSSPDHRVEQDAAGGQGRSGGAPSAQSPDSAVVVDVNAAIGNENLASAASEVTHLAAAAKLVSELVAQMAAQPASASSAQSSPSPQAVLSLLR
jgi:hypothetical protein